MKKITLSVISGVLLLLLGVTGAHAAASFNSPAAMPTITITNNATNPCTMGPISGCWKTSVNANPGDEIAVHVYYENTGNDVARDSTLSVKPGGTSGISVNRQTFIGGVASTTAPRSVGNAVVSINGSAEIEYVSGSARWYPSAASGPRAVNESALFGDSGFYIGDVYPGEQGVLVVNFRLIGNTNPQQYECNDGYDNDGDGRVDYPSDPGCSSATDNSEYNSVQQDDECRIDSFTADDYSINDGDSTRLRWTTTDCDYVSISSAGSALSADGSTSVSPSSTRTYTLTAYPNGGSRSLTIDVDGDNDECEIDSFRADDTTIDSGDRATLRWSTTGCDYVNISNVGNGYSADGSATVRPSNTRTYTLTAYPGGDTARVTIRVADENDECRIDSFTADDYSIARGDSVRIRWSTTGADDVDITPGYSNRSDDGTITVSPTSTTTYTVRVSGNGCSDSDSLTVVVSGGATNTRPQAITTVATALSGTSAQLNGIAVPNTNNSNTTAWFEYGPGTSLGMRTSARTIGVGNSSFPYSDAVSGLVPNVDHYYRAVVQNKNGTAYGDIVRIPRPVNTVANTTTTVVSRPTVTTPSRQSDLVIANSQPSLLELRVESVYDRMCIGGDMDYTITYRNVSNTRLDDAVLQVQLPKELTYANASRGNYDAQLRTLTIDVGTVAPDEQGTVTVRARVNDLAIRDNLSVMTATVVYTNSNTRAQEDAIAYSLITVSDDCPNLLGASVFGFGSFLPDTLIEWLLLILIILALIVLGRNLYKKKDQKPA